MSDYSKDLEEAFGVPVRKLEPSDFPPDLAFILGVLSTDVNSVYVVDINSHDSKN